MLGGPGLRASETKASDKNHPGPTQHPFRALGLGFRVIIFWFRALMLLERIMGLFGVTAIVLTECCVHDFWCRFR